MATYKEEVKEMKDHLEDWLKIRAVRYRSIREEAVKFRAQRGFTSAKMVKSTLGRLRENDLEPEYEEIQTRAKNGGFCFHKIQALEEEEEEASENEGKFVAEVAK